MPDVYIPVKNKILLEQHNIFIPKSTFYRWSHYNKFPGLFKKITGHRELFIDLSKYNELFQEAK